MTATEYLRSTLRHGLLYGFATILAKVIGFVMIPLYTRVLTPADYGVLELLSMTTDVIGMAAGLGLTWSVTRYYYAYDKPRDRRAVVGSAAILGCLLFGAATLLALPWAGAVSAVVLGDQRHGGLVRLTLASLFLSSFIEIPLAYLRARQASGRVVIVGLARLALGLTLNILFLAVLRLGVAGVLYSGIITSALAAAYLATLTIRETGLVFSPSIARRLLAYGAPIVAADLGSFILHYSDRYFLRAYDSLATVGLYSLAYKFAMLLSVFIATPFAQIWAPKVLEIERAEGDGGKAIVRRILAYYNVVLVAGALGVALLAGDAIRLMASPEFHAADRTIPVLALAMLFFGYRQVSYVGAAIRERSDLIAFGTVVGAMVALGANLLLIPRWGAMGAAWATLVAFAADFAVVMTCSERVYPLGLPMARLFGPVVLAGAMYLAAHLVVPLVPSLALAVAVKLAAVALFAAMALLPHWVAPGRGGIRAGVRPVPTTLHDLAGP